MGFIEQAAHGAMGVDLSLERIRRGEDHGAFNPRPDIDPQQQRQLIEDQVGGRTDEMYRSCLEHFRFVWYPIDRLPTLEGGVARTEGEWRNHKLRLAFTPTELASGFPTGPEALDGYLKDVILSRQVARGRVEKKALRQQRRRRSST